MNKKKAALSLQHYHLSLNIVVIIIHQSKVMLLLMGVTFFAQGSYLRFTVEEF